MEGCGICVLRRGMVVVIDPGALLASSACLRSCDPGALLASSARQE